MKTLYADTINGVMDHGDDDHITDTVTEIIFYESLSTLSDDEYIKCENVSDAMVDKIQEEFGIH